jgi:hypothetical protein
MSRHKQAVVLIHGIGEQRPLETLRSFVDAILPETTPGSNIRYRSKPDRMSESFELRCLQVPSNRDRPITDFYEYYWAHHMQNSKYISVIAWLYTLLARPIGQVPKNLYPFYFTTYVGVLAVAIILIWGLIGQTGQSLIQSFVSLYKTNQFYIAIFIAIAELVVSRFILGYIADAARYLTPSPSNIEARNKIRSEGIKLIRTLHKSNKYFRIIVIGHSLGSVIGYDILRHLWVDLRESHAPHLVKQPNAKNFDAMAADLLSTSVPIANDILEKFQQNQHELWREHRSAGIPWLVTDFITIGSPLTYASLLLANTPKEFEQRKEDFEFPCCPPISIQDSHYAKQYIPLDMQHPLCIRIPHHGALFASTRWTNLFFPCRYGIFGDFIGGSLANILGHGIRDVPVHPSRDGFLRKTIYSHVCYWESAGTTSAKHEKKQFESLKALQAAMRLESMRSREPWPEPTQLKND